MFSGVVQNKFTSELFLFNLMRISFTYFSLELWQPGGVDKNLPCLQQLSSLFNQQAHQVFVLDRKEFVH